MDLPLQQHVTSPLSRGQHTHTLTFGWPTSAISVYNEGQDKQRKCPKSKLTSPDSLLDALDDQGENRFHRGSSPIYVQQLAGDEACLVCAEENHGVPDVGWKTEAPHGRPAALVPIPNHLEHLRRQTAENTVSTCARADDVHRDALLGESDREITSQRLLRGFR